MTFLQSTKINFLPHEKRYQLTRMKFMIHYSCFYRLAYLCSSSRARSVAVGVEQNSPSRTNSRRFSSKRSDGCLYERLTFAWQQHMAACGRQQTLLANITPYDKIINCNYTTPTIIVVSTILMQSFLVKYASSALKFCVR
jgi:hypothetical protein